MLLKKDTFDALRFSEVLESVERSEECIVETPDSVYTLKPEAVERFKELSGLLRGTRVGSMIRDRGVGCGDCVRERKRALTAAMPAFRRGRTPEALAQLDGIPRHDYLQCAECAEDTRGVVERLRGAERLVSLGREDFTRTPITTSFSKSMPEEYRIVEEYEVPIPGGMGFRARILEAPDGYHYDPVLPVEALGVKERGLLNRAFRELRGSPGDPEQKLDEVLRETGDSLVASVMESLVRGLGDLEHLFHDKNLTDIFVYPTGSVEVSSMNRDMGCTLRLTSMGLEKIASSYRRITGEFFYQDFPLSSYFWEAHNCRISAVGYSANYTQTPDLSVRLWPEKPWSVLDLVGLGSMSFEMAALLTAAANLGGGTVVGGGRASGKSTLLQTYLFMIPRRARKIALLTAREIHRWFSEKRFRISEIRVHTGEHVSSKGVPIDEGVKHMLVHGESPYVIFNEVKYREEAAPFFTAAAASGMNAVLTTMHAKTAEDIVQRMLIDYELPLTALRTVKWIPVARVDQKPGSSYKRRVIGEITEVLPFESDPVNEGALKKLAEYDFHAGGWRFAGVEQLTDGSMAEFIGESEFLRETGRRIGLDREELAEYVLLFRDVYRETYDRFGGAPDADTFLWVMETLFSCFPEEGFTGKERQAVLGRWRVEMSRGLSL